MSSPTEYAAAPAPTSAPASPGAVAPTPSPPAPASAAAKQSEHSSAPILLGGADLPTGLARWQALLTTGVIVWALLTAVLLGNSWDKTRSGVANTAQLTRIHAIESSLFQADAIATNAFLVGGLEPVEQRQAYDDALAEASSLITESAQAQPADKLALSELNHEVLLYAEQMQQARANNRQGLPVGAQYLREASEQLSDDIVPILRALIDANSSRALGSLGGHWTMLVALPGVALVIVLLWFHQQLALLFRRRINIGVASATALVALATIAAVGVTWSIAADASSLKTGEFATATNVAKARAVANDAKSNESLRLIARGSGATYEEKWVEKDGEVRDLINGHGTVVPLWADYHDAHEVIVAADEGGDWDEAVSLAVDRAPGSATSKFIAFDEAAQGEVGRTSKIVISTLQGGTIRTMIAAIATVLAAALALAALSWGVTQRRREFA